MEFKKIRELIKLSRFDVCHINCYYDPNNMVYNAKTKQGVIKLFKTLISSLCSFDCKYCRNAWSKGFRASPEEIVECFKQLRDKEMVSGAFISNSISDPEKSMDEVIEVGEKIRRFHNGYLHLKVIPGALKDQIKRAVELANRVSINIETPSKSIFSEVCSVKDRRGDIIRRLRWIAKEVKKQNKRREMSINRNKSPKKSFTSQIIVGIGERDREILKVSERIYKLGASRVYFSAFNPIKGTPMESLKPERKERIVNLYKADFLIREYGYSIKDIEKIMINGMLPNDDPKILIATMKDDLKPIEIPGIGKKMIKLIEEGISLMEIKKMGYSIKRVSAFHKNQMKLSQFIE